MFVRHVPLCITLATICATLVFGVHCSGGGSVGSGFTEAQLYCQAAAVQLTNCCPDYNPAFLSCDEAFSQTVNTSSCTGVAVASRSTTTTSTNYPTLTGPESMCILGETCESLRSSGVCTRATENVGHGPMTSSATVSTVQNGCGTETTYEDAEVDANDLDANPPSAPDAGEVCP
jgi:hypothetical protein